MLAASSAGCHRYSCDIDDPAVCPSQREVDRLILKSEDGDSEASLSLNIYYSFSGDKSNANKMLMRAVNQDSSQARYYLFSETYKSLPIPKHQAIALCSKYVVGGGNAADKDESESLADERKEAVAADRGSITARTHMFKLFTIRDRENLTNNKQRCLKWLTEKEDSSK
jgi:hypothetical protein